MSGRRSLAPAPVVQIGKLFDRQPPASLEAEMALLGSLILDIEQLEHSAPLLGTAHPFYSDAHNAIYAGILKTYQKGRQLDLVSLCQILTDQGVLEQIGGPNYLVQLAESVPSAVNAPYYAKVVSNMWKHREVIDTAGQLLWNIYNDPDTADGEHLNRIVDDAQSRMYEIIESSRTDDQPASLGEALQLEMARQNSRTDDGAPVPTGYPALDELLGGGLQPGELGILAARPSMGKTAYALNLCENISTGANAYASSGVCLFSLEMTRDALSRRFIAMRAGVDQQRLRQKTLREQEWPLVIQACEELAELPIQIDDASALTVAQIRARARRMRLRHRVGVIIIDYLQLVTDPANSRENRQVEVASISRSLKTLARELKIPILALAQLNRDVEKRSENRPRLSDLRESGAIEQDADLIMFLHREEYYHRDDPDWAMHNNHLQGKAEVIIAKQRNGPTGKAWLDWDNRIGRFRDCGIDPTSFG